MLALLQNLLLAIVPWLAVLTVIVLVHEMGHFLMARAFGIAVDRFSMGFGQTLWARRDRHGIEWRLAAIPLGGYVRFAGDADPSSSVPDAEDLADLRRQIVERQGAAAVDRYFHFRPLWQRALVVLAGPAANFVLATLIFAVMLSAYGEGVIRPRVAAIVPDSAAAAAGFQPGDLITAMNGKPVDNFAVISRYAMFHAGEPTRFTVQRGNETLGLTATPRPFLRPDPLMGKPMKMGLIGLAPSRARGDYYIRRLNPVQAVAAGFGETLDTLDITARYMGRVLTGRESGDQLGGPIRTALMSKALTESGVAAGHTLGQKVEGVAFGLVNLTALISIGIGFMNLLPIPMLDGGHLAFYAWEAVARRPVSAKVQALSYRVGLALVVGLMLFATWNDLQLPVLKILGGHVS